MCLYEQWIKWLLVMSKMPPVVVNGERIVTRPLFPLALHGVLSLPLLALCFVSHKLHSYQPFFRLSASAGSCFSYELTISTLCSAPSRRPTKLATGL